ncbi:polysaccharide deacetylase family protein [Undibacterium sp. CY21W]|uniref:polysaccharide deacetylase family protein n=1 Tax=Undibacterium sp. CY21W TaxID=2762293 RepID=UPI00164C90A8|nr:polysaccharide deacetylase family protein [Undibacterium sp. CY21W]MBC3928533.1 polysaccharide deacetylase family protein [Undibacterium sp. CY21W]
MMSLYKKASRFAARHLAGRWINLRKQQGVVSFSFDDVPASACHIGAEILERYQARGSFYVCGKLTDGTEQGQTCHSVKDLQKLIADGHEIGCHTYSHMNCANNSLSALRQDWQRNQAFFETHQLPNRGFAFPFGAYDLPSKIAASERFLYNRITGGGTHIGKADLSALRAQALYADKTDADTVLQLIQQTANEGGWLIFYSHEVRNEPGPWGTTPEQLEMALRIASQSSCRILTVEKAIDFFQS